MQHIRVNDAAQGEGDESPRPRKQRRKQRPCYSCAGEWPLWYGAPGPAGVGRDVGVGKLIRALECRRLKMKCNRKSEEHIVTYSR